MKDFVKIYESLDCVKPTTAGLPAGQSVGDVKGYFVLSGGYIAVKADMVYRSMVQTYALYVLAADLTIGFVFGVNQYGYCTEIDKFRHDKREFHVIKFIDADVNFHVYTAQEPYTHAQVGVAWKDFLTIEAARKQTDDVYSSMKKLCGIWSKRLDNFIEIKTTYGSKKIEVKNFLDENDENVKQILDNYSKLLDKLDEKYYNALILLEHMQLYHNHVCEDISSPHYVVEQCKYCGYIDNSKCKK